MAVLFASSRPLERAENIRAVYNAYDGDKAFTRLSPWRRSPEIRSGKYNLLVADEFPAESPGRAILLGHGITGGKVSGLDQRYPYISWTDTILLTYAVTTSEEMRVISARQCGIPIERALPLGMPRTDAYFGKKKGDGGTVLGGRRAYLFAPTYRAREDPPYPEIDWDLLDRLLLDGEVLAVKPHMLTGRWLRKQYRHIIEIPNTEPSTPYLIDCDVVITDYSSIIFDGYLLGKPAVLFEKNQGYLESRGMYLEYPGDYTDRYCTTETDLIRLCRAADGLSKAEKRCMNRVAGACDGHSTERVCDLIRSMA